MFKDQIVRFGIMVIVLVLVNIMESKWSVIMWILFVLFVLLLLIHQTLPKLKLLSTHFNH